MAKGTHPRGRQSELRCLAAAGIREQDERFSKRRKASQKGTGLYWKQSSQPCSRQLGSLPLMKAFHNAPEISELSRPYCAPYIPRMAEMDGANGAAEVKPNLGSPGNRPQSTMPKITTPMVLRRILATPFYVLGLAFNLLSELLTRRILATPFYVIGLALNLLSELFTRIAERIDGSSA